MIIVGFQLIIKPVIKNIHYSHTLVVKQQNRKLLEYKLFNWFKPWHNHTAIEPATHILIT